MSSPTCVADDDLAVVWATLFLRLFDSTGGELGPVIMSVTNLESSSHLREDTCIRKALDDALLESRRGQSCETVANTIFPRSLWSPTSPPDRLYARFMRVAARVQAHPANRNGTYFSRLVDFGAGDSPGSGVNQLRHVLDTWSRGNRRRSALQLAIFDPLTDHTHQRQRGFPCLHQIGLSHDQRGRLSVTGFYATQYAYERAYGNLLGLARLGNFFAHEMGLTLSQVNVVAAVELLSGGSKTSVTPLAVNLRRLLEPEVDELAARKLQRGRR